MYIELQHLHPPFHPNIPNPKLLLWDFSFHFVLRSYAARSCTPNNIPHPFRSLPSLLNNPSVLLISVSSENDIAFMSFRFWVGMWIFPYLMLMVAFDLSALVRFITRFTEECFAVLISVIFIYEAVSKLVNIWSENPVHVGIIREDANFTCRCTNSGSSSYNRTFTGSLMTSASGFDLSGENRSIALRDDCVTNSGQIEVRHGCISKGDCVEYGWGLEGEGCVPTVVNSVPDVFLLSCVLLFGTFAVAIFFPKSSHHPVFSNAG